MKQTLFVCLWLGVTFFSNVLFGQSLSDLRHYVIIGAFTSENNAERLTAKAISQSLDANYARNELRGVYYVYVLGTDDRRAAYNYVAQIRQGSEYKDAWVFSGVLDVMDDEAIYTTPVKQKIERKDEPEPETIETIEEDGSESVELETEDFEIEPVKDPNLKSFYFQLVNQETGEEVKGQVYLQKDRDDNNFEAYEGNEAIDLYKPGRDKNTYFVTVNAPGYDLVETEVKYNDALQIDQNGNTLVKIPLERSRTGDYVEFNKVRFLSNSAIFTPDSKTELDAFVQLMNDNPKYKIRVHGHVNGKFNRNATIRGDSEQFFGRSEGNKEVSASAKKLSDYRANLVKDYLVSQGISARRIKTKADGASTMLFPSSGPLSGFNDRVEIEITKGK
ncbi:MAG: OmpA family protein [Bacteroidota bacterium]